MNVKSVKSLHPCKSVVQTTYDIVKAHGGELSVDPSSASGGTFIVRLPI